MILGKRKLGKCESKRCTECEMLISKHLNKSGLCEGCRSKKWHKDNKDKINEYRRRRYKEPEVKARRKIADQTPESKERRKKYYDKKREYERLGREVATLQ